MGLEPKFCDFRLLLPSMPQLPPITFQCVRFGKASWNGTVLAQSRAWPEILEKRFLCPQCGLSSQPCPSAQWPPDVGPTLDFSMYPQICAPSAHYSTWRVTLSSLRAWPTPRHFLYISLPQNLQLPVTTTSSYSSQRVSLSTSPDLTLWDRVPAGALLSSL